MRIKAGKPFDDIREKVSAKRIGFLPDEKGAAFRLGAGSMKQMKICRLPIR